MRTEAVPTTSMANGVMEIVRSVSDVSFISDRRNGFLERSESIGAGVRSSRSPLMVRITGPWETLSDPRVRNSVCSRTSAALRSPLSVSPLRWMPFKCSAVNNLQKARLQISRRVFSICLINP